MFIVSEMRIMNNKRFQQTNNEFDTEHMGQGDHLTLHLILCSPLELKRFEKT